MAWAGRSRGREGGMGWGGWGGCKLGGGGDGVMGIVSWFGERGEGLRHGVYGGH